MLLSESDLDIDPGSVFETSWIRELSEEELLDLSAWLGKSPSEQRRRLGRLVQKMYFEKRCLGFWSRNQDLPFVFPGGVVVRFEVEGNRIVQCIQIGSDTTVQDVRDAWTHIENWGRRLESFQGPSHGENKYLAFLEKRSECSDYSAIASELNALVANHLTEYAAFCEAFERDFGCAAPIIKRFNELFSISNYAAIRWCQQNDVSDWGFMDAREILKMLRLPYTDGDAKLDRKQVEKLNEALRDEALEEMLKDLRKGREPVPKLIDGELVRKAVNRFRGHKRSHSKDRPPKKRRSKLSTKDTDR